MCNKADTKVYAVTSFICGRVDGQVGLDGNPVFARGRFALIGVVAAGFLNGYATVTVTIKDLG